MSLSPANAAAAAQPVATWVGLLQVGFPDRTVRLLDGSGTLPWGGHDFTGEDAVYGALGGLSAFSDGAGDQAASMTLTLLPPTTTAAAALARADVQGSSVMLWLGLLNPLTGLLVDDPELVFLGEIDVPTLRVGKGTRAIDYAVVSFEDRTFDDDEGFRLNDGFHQTVWPGEQGLVFLPYVGDQMPWGSDAPRPVNVTTVPPTTTIPLGRGFGGLTASLPG